MITPPFLHPGDTIGIIAPAYHAMPEQWESVIPLFSAWGLNVEPGRSLRARDRVFSGTDDQRLNDLAAMMCNPQIKAVICARGGYGTSRLLSRIDRYSQAFVPKWLIGYSDITALAAYFVTRLHWQCIHGPMPVDFANDRSAGEVQSWNCLHHILSGQMPAYTLAANSLNRCGHTVAPLIGGNLSVLYSLNATPFQWKTDHCILFLEDVNEHLYHLDRMMTNLRTGGQLARLKGFLIGSMNGMKDSDPSFGKTAYDIIAEHTAMYDYPVAFGFPAGHDKVNNPLILGASTKFSVTEEGVAIEQIP